MGQGYLILAEHESLNQRLCGKLLCMQQVCKESAEGTHEEPTRPWQTLSMDIYSYAGKEFLILVDHIEILV